MQFLFITGVSKFSKVALFSDLNNLHDLTNTEEVSSLVGYTDQEVDMYLENIQAFADKLQEPYEKIRQTLKSWYNGYRFSSADITVYNPFSLHNCLSNKLLTNYWFSSGTPNFLMKFIQKNPLIASDIETIEGSFFANLTWNRLALIFTIKIIKHSFCKPDILPLLQAMMPVSADIKLDIPMKRCVTQ